MENFSPANAKLAFPESVLFSLQNIVALLSGLPPEHTQSLICANQALAMFPVSDFNYVVAGIATFAATVGYACTRRLSTSSANPGSNLIQESIAGEVNMDAKNPLSESCSSNEQKTEPKSAPVPFEVAALNLERLQTDVAVATTSTTPARRASLKRKVPHDGFDDPKKDELGYPHNLANIYPNKRSRTPSAESETASTNSTPDVSLDSIISQTPDVDVEIPLVSHDPEAIVTTPATEPPRSPSPTPQAASPREPSPTPAPTLAEMPIPIALLPPPPSTPQPQPTTPRDTTPRPVTPKPFTSPSAGFAAFANRDTLSRPSTPKPFMSPSSGFAAFAGSTSPFAAISKPQQSPFGKGAQRSIWSSTGDLTTHQNDDESPEKAVADIFKPAETNHAIEEAKATPAHPTEKYTHVTGEEDEDVELEQKGVKLFIKRGNKPFSEGIPGQIKLLSNRTTLEERILFRREPLWKVSMNVRVQPTVRCTFVPEENVLRFILKEAVEQAAGASSESTSATETKQEIVIYAVKPGRSCSKQDFKEFSETLLKSSHFKSASSKTRSA
ncbi:hypothetical protein BDZ97DRAFT_122029 [Flammula alnicola]|nr:hypothetical protein BDZ97DRAFT_122029 [Flammula alnicola]